ncbi:hypothetical protein [Acidimangrovimonas sediminis]|uniref:hypothetical protein n=1 Tax=Acidimangrovimonas sediminis TaxID=2056283 RepID=UPI000C7F975D|nr:hypothetical protein [Acidimangrovimonas sediminis]
MYLREISPRASARADADHGDPLRIFMSNHLNGLRDAAGLLAGQRGVRLVETIADRLHNDTTRIARATWLAIRDLLGILTLEHVHDERRPEAGFFARIDPADPVVEEVCLLTDGLRAALEKVLAAEPEAVRLLEVA